MYPAGNWRRDKEPKRSHNQLGLYLALTALLLCTTACSRLALAQDEYILGNPPVLEPEIEIRFLQHTEGKTPIVPVSGWPLSLTLSANEDRLLGIGMGMMTPAQTFPSWQPDGELPGFLVFDDPDGCPSFVLPIFQEGMQHVEGAWITENPRVGACTPPAPPWPQDETWLQFKPGLNLPTPATCGDQLRVVTHGGQSEIGPCTGSGDDGYGYGINPLLPGLVLLSDSGPGVVFDIFFRHPEGGAEARNLAGFFQSVSYQLADTRGRTEILVQ